MRTDYTDMMDAVRFKDTVNSFKSSHEKTVEELIELLKGEVIELENAVRDESKANALLEVADIVVFAGLLFNKIKIEERK